MTIEAPLWWEDGALCLLDQTRLPHEVRTVRCTSWEEVAEAIRGLRVRGAPAIGLAAAYGLVLAAATDAGLRVVVARPFPHVGAGQAPTFWVAKRARVLLEAKRRGAPAVTVGDRASRRRGRSVVSLRSDFGGPVKTQ